MSSLAASIKELGVLQPVLVRGIGGELGRVRAHRRRAPLAGGPPGRAPDHPGAGPDVRTIPTASSRPWWRTSTARTSTSSRRRPPTSSSSRSSATPTTRWPPGWGRAGRRSPTSCACCSCPSGVQRLLAEGQISPGHARALLGTPDRGYQEVLAKRVVADGLTVRAIEELVRGHNDEANGVVRTGGADGVTPPDGRADRARTGAVGRDRGRPAGARPRRLPPPGSSSSRSCCPSHLNTRVKVDMSCQAGQGRGGVRHPRGPRADLQADGGRRGRPPPA